MIRLVATLVAALGLIAGVSTAPFPIALFFVPAGLVLGWGIAEAWISWSEARRTARPEAAE